MDNRTIFIQDLKKRISSLQSTMAHLEGTLAYYETLPEELTETERITVQEGAYRILKESGDPLNRHAIFEALKAMDIPVNGQQPLNNLTAHMSNDARIESLEKGSWGLREWREQFESASDPYDDVDDLPF